MGTQQHQHLDMSFKDGKAYWESHYAGTKDTFDWYQQYSHLEVLLQGVANDSNVLITGAGTSMIGLELAKRGVAQPTNIEQSQAAVQAMKGVDSESLCRWDCGDVTQMGYPNDNFDFVVDKAVLDAILCQEGGTRLSQAYLRQVARVLKPSGKLICVSTGKEEIRKPYLTEIFGTIDVEPINKPSTSPVESADAPKHFIYICADPHK